MIVGNGTRPLPRRRGRPLPSVPFGVLLVALAILVAPAGSPSSGGVGRLQAELPNIVVVMTDDEPAVDGRLLDFMPNARAVFRDQGVRFPNMTTSTPLCCPARASYLTGLYAHHHGVTQNESLQFQPSETLATKLHALGYHTLLVGKYFNHYDCGVGENCAPNVPPGWDRWAAFGDPSYYGYDLWIDGNPDPEHHGSHHFDYSTDVLAEKADTLIRSAPADRPLFAWIAPNAPHNPTTPARRHRRASCKAGTWQPPDWNEEDVSDKPAYVRALPLLETKTKLVRLCRTLLAVDDLVGRVHRALADTGRLENTLFVYAGDNGMNEGEHRLLRKSAPYETRVPFYLSWPAGLGLSPRVVPDRISNIDLAPTLCDLAGCTLGPFPTGQAEPDGRSFLPLLLGFGAGDVRDALLEELPEANGAVPAWEAVVTTPESELGLWHYVEYETGERELYDVSGGPCWSWQVGQPGDPCELVNLVDDPAYAEVVQALDQRLAELRSG